MSLEIESDGGSLSHLGDRWSWIGKPSESYSAPRSRVQATHIVNMCDNVPTHSKIDARVAAMLVESK